MSESRWKRHEPAPMTFPGEIARSSSTSDSTEIVADRCRAVASGSEADVSVRANQDQRMIGNSIGAEGVSIGVDQCLVVHRDPIPWTDDSVGAQGALVGVGQPGRGLLAEGQERPMRSPEEVEEPDWLTACGLDSSTGIRGTAAAPDSCAGIQGAGKAAALVGQTQLEEISDEIHLPGHGLLSTGGATILRELSRC